MNVETRENHRPTGRWRMLRHGPTLLLAWAVGYGALRAWWAAGHAPRFVPMPDDLLLTGWWPVVLCAVVGGAALVALLVRDSRPVANLLWILAGATLVVNPLLLLDAVGGVLFGLGIPLNVASVGARLGMFVGTVLLALTARSYRRHAVGACGHCGRTSDATVADRTPRWAYLAAYVAVAGCLVRIGAQLALGFGDMMYRAGAAMVAFEGGFLLAGILLPTALVHRFGRVWPRWVLPLAGRRVPRWLVLGPGFFIGLGLTVYFGFAFVQLLAGLVTGTPDELQEAYGAGFVWTAVPGYLLWGVGVLIASVARFRVTRSRCRHCGRG